MHLTCSEICTKFKLLQIGSLISELRLLVCLFICVRFYGPVNTIKVMLSQSVNQLKLFLGNLGGIKLWFFQKLYMTQKNR